MEQDNKYIYVLRLEDNHYFMGFTDDNFKEIRDICGRKTVVALYDINNMKQVFGMKNEKDSYFKTMIGQLLLKVLKTHKYDSTLNFENEEYLEFCEHKHLPLCHCGLPVNILVAHHGLKIVACCNYLLKNRDVGDFEFSSCDIFSHYT